MILLTYHQYHLRFSVYHNMREFNVSQAKEIHGDKYDYKLVEYKNVDTKVKIICPIHGLFLQTPYHHIHRKQGCGKCKGSKASKSQRKSWYEYVKRSNEIHNNKYKYVKKDISNAHSHVTIICPIHGEFQQNFNNHIYNKNGCPNCGYNCSKLEKEWLDSLKIPNLIRQKHLSINGRRFKVDAFDKDNNTIYEYMGYFWHGHPDFFNPEDINPRNKETYGSLYSKTLEKIKFLEDSGFKVVIKWG